MYQSVYRCPFPNGHSHISSGEANRIKNKLRTFGEGRVRVRPDLAQVVIGVTTEGRELEAVQQENARITQQVINSIKNEGVASRDIQTQAYNIEPQYDYIEGRQVFRGYRVINLLSITIRDLAKVGEVIDAAVRAGANVVNNINFIVSEPAFYYNQALRLAIEDAQNKAFAITDKLKVSLNLVPIEITEQGSVGGVPLAPMVLKASTEATTPIEAGENEIIARIEAVFVYSD